MSRSQALKVIIYENVNFEQIEYSVVMILLKRYKVLGRESYIDTFPAMESITGHCHEPQSDGDSTFMMFVGVLIFIGSILLNMMWKATKECYYFFTKAVNEKRCSDQETATQSRTRLTRDASTQTRGEYSSENQGQSPPNMAVYITKQGERWHKPGCKHIVGRTTKMLSPCSDCIKG